jgi:hypothetical protein
LAKFGKVTKQGNRARSRRVQPGNPPPAHRPLAPRLA